MGMRANVTVEMSTITKLLLTPVGKAGTPATVLHEFSPIERTFFVVVEFGLTGSFSVWGGFFRKQYSHGCFIFCFLGNNLIKTC